MLSKSLGVSLLSAIAISSAFAVQTASADMITDWNYNVVSGFTQFTGNGGDGAITASGDDGGSAHNPTKLSWGSVRGTPTGTYNPSKTNGQISQSSISITSPVPGTIQTNGPAADGALFTHHNVKIPDSSNTLTSFNLNTRLFLTATLPASEAGQSPSIPSLTFDSLFTETPNQSGQCVPGSVSTCDDIFVLSNSDTLGGPAFTQHFRIDDYDYTSVLSIVGLDNLTDAQCAAAGADSGCIGFLTQENKDNTFQGHFTITATKAVPEPGNFIMLALGLGLIGFGFYARRRNPQV